MKEKISGGELLKIRAYRIFAVIRILAFAAASMTAASLFALLISGTKQVWSFVCIGLGSGAAGCLCAGAMMRFLRHPMLKDPTWLMIIGFTVWLIGMMVCLISLASGKVYAAPACVALAFGSAGGALGFRGLSRIDDLVPGMAEVTGRDGAPYRKNQSARLISQLIAGFLITLAAVAAFLLVNGRAWPAELNKAITSFILLLILPAVILLAGAVTGAFFFPLSTRYIDKLNLFPHLKAEGREKPVLHRQLKHVITEPYRQGWLTRFLVAVLRRGYPHRLINTDHIVLDDDNPLVFLGNHAEIYGPIVCILHFPVPIRTWTINMMMFDRKVVTPYLYENTFSKKTFLPVFMRKGLALFLGWLSVHVMRQLENIPVYKDSPLKLRDTLRQSIDALEAGDNLLIFPEAQEGKYQKGGIGRIAPGFVMLAEAYWKKTGKKMRMLPLYANHDVKTITFGEIITYEPEKGFREEEDRIVEETAAQINRMAEEGTPAAADHENEPVPEGAK